MENRTKTKKKIESKLTNEILLFEHRSFPKCYLLLIIEIFVNYSVLNITTGKNPTDGKKKNETTLYYKVLCGVFVCAKHIKALILV